MHDLLFRRHSLFLILLALRYGLPLAMAGSIAAGSHDNLDSEVVYSVVLGRFWAGGWDDSHISVFLGGALAWSDFARTLHPLTLLYAVLPPVWAYAVTDAAMLILAYVGMLALLTILDLRKDTLVACLAAFGMSYTSYGAGLAALPLLLALIWTPGPARLRDVLLAAVLGANSAFALHAIFAPLAALALALMLGQWPNARRALVLGGGFLAVSLAAAGGLLIQALAGVESHRADWVPVAPANPVLEWAGATLANLVTMGSANHAVVTPALHVPVILVAALFAGRMARRAALVLAGFVALAMLLATLTPWITASVPSTLASIQWSRFLLLMPMLVLVLAAILPGRGVRAAVAVSLGLAAIAGMGGALSALGNAVPESVMRQARDSLSHNETRLAIGQVMSSLVEQGGAGLLRGVETWDRHFRPIDYACLRDALAAEPQPGRVMSYGPDPMIAPFHAIAAIDGYHNFYPLAVKRSFRPVIAPLLAADPALASYFDTWGSRIGTLISRARNLPADIHPDWAAAARLGVTHVIADRPAPGLDVVTTCAGLRLYRNPH